MRSHRLLALGLALVVICNAITTNEEEVQELGKAKKAKALDIASKDKLMAHEAMNEKDLLPLPGMPDWAKVKKRIEDITKSQCKSACEGDADCAGFQYVAAEQLCQMFESPKKPDNQISVNKAKKMLKDAVKKAVKESKSKSKTKEKKAVKSMEKAVMPKVSKSAGAKFRKADKKLGIEQKKYKKAKAAAKEAARKSKGARAAEVITKSHEHDMMMKELRAAKDAQAAGLNFEEQVIMAKSPTSKNVLLAKAHKTTQMQQEEKADAEYEEAKVVMKKGLKLQSKMKERKVKRVEQMVRAKTKMNKAEAKFKLAGKHYKAQERKLKNAQDEQKEKLAAKARIFLKKQNKKAERHAKAVETATGANKEAKVKKCRKAQVKMRKLKFKLKRRLKKQIYARERKVADKKIERMKRGMSKATMRKVALVQKESLKAAHKNVRRMFDMSEMELSDLVAERDQELGETEDPKEDMAKKTADAKMAAEKAKVAAEFKKKEQADAQNAASEKSKEVSAKSEEVNQLKLDLAGGKNVNDVKMKLGALEPELETAKVDLKKAEDLVTSLRDAAAGAEKKAEADNKEAAKDGKDLEKAQAAKADAKIKLEEETQKAKADARNEEYKLRQKMQAETTKKAKAIRKHIRNKAKEIIKTKWAEMKRTLKLKVVHCEASKETEAEKLKTKLKILQQTMNRIKKSDSERRAKLKRKSLEEKRSKRWAKDQMKVKLKEEEHAMELKEKKTIKDKEKTAAAEVADAKADEEKEKTIAKANQKKADLATAEAKAEADKLKSEEQAAAANKVPAAPAKDAPPPAA